MTGVGADDPSTPYDVPLTFPDWPRDSVSGPWATPADAARYWPDSTALDPDTLAGLLEAATETCRSYSPAILELGQRQIAATVFTARDVWNARQADYGTGDVLGGDVTFTPRGMSAQVRRLLRPDIGVVIG